MPEHREKLVQRDAWEHQESVDQLENAEPTVAMEIQEPQE